VIIVDSDDSHDDAVEHVQGEPAKRRRQDSEDADAALARKLQADELRRRDSDEALARRLQEEEVSGGGGAGGPGRSLKRSRSGVWNHDQAQPHPVFKADGLGFWLLHTEGIEKEANSPEYVVRLRDVVVGDIKWAVLSNYLYDMEWLLKEIPKLGDIPCVSILYHGQDNAVPLQFRKLPPNFRAFAPPLPDRYGTHHSKFVLLGYETGIRVVVLTCNHIRQDHHYFLTQIAHHQRPTHTHTHARTHTHTSDEYIHAYQARPLPYDRRAMGARLSSESLFLPRTWREQFQMGRAHIYGEQGGADSRHVRAAVGV